MNCQDFREIIDSYLSDELLTETNHDILRHLGGCAVCRGEIEARRAVRIKLRTAVFKSAQFTVDPGFVPALESKLGQIRIGDGGLKSRLRITQNSFLAAAASVLIICALGFVLYNQFRRVEDPAAVKSVPVITELPAADLINVALGDHQHCAIKYDLEETPVSLEQASEKYRDLDKVVVRPLRRVLSKYELLEAHACRYKETRFAHFVLRNKGKTLSVLMTEMGGIDGTQDREILKFTSESQSYEIAGFKMDRYAVFVVSDLDRERNSQVLDALSGPLQKHFAEKKRIQAALLAVYR